MVIQVNFRIDLGVLQTWYRVNTLILSSMLFYLKWLDVLNILCQNALKCTIYIASQEEEEGASEKKVTEIQKYRLGTQNRNGETKTKDHIQNQAHQVRWFMGCSSVGNVCQELGEFSTDF